MPKHGVLIGALATAAAIGVAASPASAATVRVDTNMAGVKRILFTETGVKDPITGLTTFAGETNTVKITLVGTDFHIADTGTPLTAGAKCTAIDANTASCPSALITQLRVDLGALDDSFDNQTAMSSNVTGGPGIDTIVNAGSGDDLVDVKGSKSTDKDVIQTCGAGADTVLLDGFDPVAPADCETMFVDGTQIRPVPAPPVTPPVTPPVAPPVSPPVTPPATTTPDTTSSQGGGQVQVPSVPGPVTPAPLTPSVPFTAPSLQKPATATTSLAGSAHLRGRVVSAALRCAKTGRATLSSHGRRLASVSFTCRAGRAAVRFTVTRKSAATLKKSRKPGLVIAVKVGATTTNLRPRLAH